MAYERLNLKDGEKLKAKHLAHIEDGIENAGGATMYEHGYIKSSGALFPVGAEHAEENVVPWADVVDAFNRGVVRVAKPSGDSIGIGTMVCYYPYGSTWTFEFIANGSTISSGNTVYSVE